MAQKAANVPVVKPNQTATLIDNRTGKSVELPILDGSDGPAVSFHGSYVVLPPGAPVAGVPF